MVNATMTYVETTDHDYKQLDSEYDATSAANKELVAAFHSTEKSVKLFLAKLQILGECPSTPVEELLEKSKRLFDDLALPALNDLTSVYKRVYDRMVKRRHKMIDYDKLRLALAKADPHKAAKLQIKYDAATREYNSHNESLKRELPQLFRYRRDLVETLMKEYDAFMNEFFLIMQRLLSSKSGQAKTYDEIQSDFNKHEQMIHEMISGLSLVSMDARRSESAVDQLTSKIKSTFKKEKISSIANRSRSSTAYSQRALETAPTNGSMHRNENDVLNNIQQRKLDLSQVSLKPSAQPNAKQVHPPPPPPQISSKKPLSVIAMFDFNGQEQGDLSFKAGDCIEIVKRTDSKEDWWTGKIKGREGIFPANYVKDL